MSSSYVCERCREAIAVDEEYEELNTHFFHEKCYLEGLVGAIVSAPNQEQLEQMKGMTDMVKNVAAYFGVPDVLDQLPTADPHAMEKAFKDFENDTKRRKK